MSHANAFMWFMIGLLTVLVLWRVYERSAVPRLRRHVTRLHGELAEVRAELAVTRDEAASFAAQLERTNIDWLRAERKLARARTSRARWQAQAANWQRAYNAKHEEYCAEVRSLKRWYSALRPAQQVALATAQDALVVGQMVKVAP